MARLTKRFLGLLLAGGLLAMSLIAMTSAPASAGKCTKVGQPPHQHIDCTGHEGGPGGPGKPPGPGPKQPYDVYKTPACSINHAPPNDPGVMCMGAGSICKTRGQQGIFMWVFIQWTKGGKWERGTSECSGGAQNPTPQQVRDALVSQYLLGAKADINPAGRTLIDFPTIFYAEPPQAPPNPVKVLDQNVYIDAPIIRYVWHTGEGDFTSTGPGVPFSQGTDKSRYLTYNYRATGQYSASVTVVYDVTYHLDDGVQHSLGQIPIDSNQTQPIQVVQSKPELGGN